MEQFDSNKQFSNLIREFKRTDEFYNSFRHQFIITLFLIVKRHYKEKLLTEEMDKMLRLYADEMLSCVESVLYKNLTYPDYRLEEEVEMMARVAQKQPRETYSVAFINDAHRAAKEMLVNHYDAIYDLSADGFRLLEHYTKMYNWEFISNFYGENVLKV